MRRSIVLLSATLFALQVSAVLAQDPDPIVSPAGSASVEAASPTLVTGTVTATTMTPTLTSEAPVALDTEVVRPEQTATPTPALPEEGGPPGGVISGRIYRDQDRSGAFSKDDETIAGSIVSVEWDQGGGRAEREARTDESGHWEIRGLADGRYDVQYELDSPEQRSRTIPPAQRISQGPAEETYNLPPLYGITFSVEIKDASRVTDVNFGLPARTPIAGSTGITTPNAGTGSGSSQVAAWVLAAAIALSIGGAAVFAIARRRAH